MLFTARERRNADGTKGNEMSLNIVSQGSLGEHTVTAKNQNDETLASSSFRQEYHEVGAKHVVEMDALEQLKSNITQLEDLHNRLKFMMTELNYLLKKS
jgi:hypothetical protein